MKRFKASVVGGEGTVGTELSRLLSTHPDVELASDSDRFDVALLAGPREAARSEALAGARIVDVVGALEPKFVRVVADRPPELEAVVGSNVAEIGFALGEPISGLRTLVVFSALDDLGKGGAGQAIQCMNLMLGLPETAGLGPGLTQGPGPD